MDTVISGSLEARNSCAGQLLPPGICAPWGKTFTTPDGEVGTQPLICHLVDTAAVMEAILRGEVYCRHIAQVNGAPVTEGLIQRLSVLALWHDYGKFSPAFQRRKDGSRRDTLNHIVTAFKATSRALKEKNPLCAMLKRWCAGAPHGCFFAWRNLTIGHHGDIPPSVDITKYQRGRDGWDDGSLELLKELYRLTKSWFPTAFEEHGGLPDDTTLEHLIAGTITLADWIASDRSLFPYCGESDGSGIRPRPEELTAEELIADSRARAARVLNRIGWDLGAFKVPRADFQRSFPFAPNSVQSAIDSLPLSFDGGLWILEAETGSGKTEAALYLFSRLLSAGLVESLYLANPTRFAASQLHRRVVDYADRTFGNRVPVTLAVPGYHGVGDGCKVPTCGVEGKGIADYVIAPDPSTEWTDRSDVPLENWSALNAKRYLTAPLAVGTVDQALLAALNVRHATLRAAALQRSLLVIDEVHSSDAYTGEIIVNLLRLFSRCGGHILLMSATLSDARRKEFLAAWQNRRKDRRGAQTGRLLTARADAQATGDAQPQAGEFDPAALPYPLITGADGTMIAPHSSARSKSVMMAPLSILEDPEQIAHLAADAVAGGEQGPCVLIIRNTVRSTRLTLRELAKVLPPERLLCAGDVPVAHHGRYAPEDRRSLDRAVEERLGKGVPRKSLRSACVVVGTQTLEQSLDIDADLLITDLVPADVLLQRIGRLHRHLRRRPEGFSRPRCVVLLPNADVSWLLGDECSRYGYGKGRAYDDVLALAATWRLLVEQSTWELPRCARGIIERSLDPNALKRLVQQLPGKGWAQARAEGIGSDLAGKSAARLYTINWDEEPQSVPPGVRIPTRIGAGDFTVTISSPIPSPLPPHQPLRTFHVPEWFFTDDLPTPDAHGIVHAEAETDGQTIRLTVGENEFFYTSCGLLSEREYSELNG